MEDAQGVAAEELDFRSLVADCASDPEIVDAFNRVYGIKEDSC